MESARVSPSSGWARSRISFATGSDSTAWAQLAPALERVGERLAGALGNHLREAVDGAVGDVEDPPRVADGRARGHRREGDDLRDPVATVLVGDVVDDPIAPGDGEVDVHVGQVLAGRVQEALEEEAVADRVDVGDLEAVGRERTGRRAAARPHADAVRLREVDEVPDDQEVVREAHLLDRLQLEAEAVGELRRRLPVALAEPLLAELDEVVEGVASFRHREGRKQDAAELELDRAALGDLERARHGVLEPGEVAGHLLLRLEEVLVRVEAPVAGVLERVAGLDAEERLVGVRVLGVEVVDVARCHQRETCLLGQRDELGVEHGLLLEACVLDLDVGRVAAEDLHEPVEVGVRVAVAVLGERARDAAGEAARERDQAVRVPLEELPVDARLVVVALEVAERGELDQVRVTLARLREERQVRIALRLLRAVVGDVGLAAEDRLHARRSGLAKQLDRTRERAVVGERDSGHLEPGGFLHEGRDAARAVQNRVLRVHVQVDERRRSGTTHGRAIVLPSGDGTLSPPGRGFSSRRRRERRR